MAGTPSGDGDSKSRGKRGGRPTLLLSVRNSLSSRPDVRAITYSDASLGDAAASQQSGPELRSPRAASLVNTDRESTRFILIDSEFRNITQISSLPRLSIVPI